MAPESNVRMEVNANDVVAFVVELAALALIGLWGYRAGGPLWARIAVALVYLLVGTLCAWGCYSFFHDAVALSDWVFGTMSFGLVLVALLGIKESLFPSHWTPE